MNQNRIVLTRTPLGWVATHSGPLAEKIVELFRTNTLPTAFTADAPPDMVLAAIRRGNPLCQVEIEQGAAA
jgi:hypothetical protein